MERCHVGRMKWPGNQGVNLMQMKGGGVPAGEVERCEWVGEKEEEGKPGEAVRRNKWVWKERWSPPMKEDWTSVHESTSIVVKGLSQIRRGPTKKK